jgi:hypothetical protein
MIPSQSTEIAKMMSASVAPVFLITGIAGILSIIVVRYGRVIDRIRTLLREGPRLYQTEVGADHLEQELRSLYGRARRLRRTIILEITAAFLVVLTIFSIFFSLSFEVNVYYAPMVFFIMSLTFLLLGLVLLIRDFAASLICIEHDMKVRGRLTGEADKSTTSYQR